MREALIVLMFFIGVLAVALGLIWYASREATFLDVEADPWR